MRHPEKATEVMHLKQDLSWAMPTIELPRNICIVSSEEKATSLHVPHDISTEDLFDLATAMALIKVLRDFGLVQHRR